LITEINLAGTKRNILRSIVGLARLEGMSVVAEGIETEDEAKVVRGLGCGYLQGFFMGRPVGTAKSSCQATDGSLY